MLLPRNQMMKKVSLVYSISLYTQCFYCSLLKLSLLIFLLEIEKTEVHPPAESPKAEVRSDNDVGEGEVQPNSESEDTDNSADPKLLIPEEHPSEIRDHRPENKIYVEKG